MEVFSSALMTYSPSPRTMSFHVRAAVLPRLEYVLVQPPTHGGEADTDEAMLRAMASRASSGYDQLDGGAPVSADNWQASALIWAADSAVNEGGRPGRLRTAGQGRPSSANRPRHFRTVSTRRPAGGAMRALERPLAVCATICARIRAEHIRLFGDYSTPELGIQPDAYDPQLDVGFTPPRDGAPGTDAYRRAARRGGSPWVQREPVRSRRAGADGFAAADFGTKMQASTEPMIPAAAAAIRTRFRASGRAALLC